MASFNVSNNFGQWLKTQGFDVIQNLGMGMGINKHCGSRPMVVFAPESLKGKAAKRWFNKIFWLTHKRVQADCQCCSVVVSKLPTA